MGGGATGFGFCCAVGVLGFTRSCTGTEGAAGLGSAGALLALGNSFATASVSGGEGRDGMASVLSTRGDGAGSDAELRAFLDALPSATFKKPKPRKRRGPAPAEVSPRP